MIKSAISAQQEFSNKFDIVTFLPENYQKMMDNSLESYLKMHSLYSESFRKSLDVMKQSTKSLSDNSNGYANLASSIFQLYVPQFSK